MTSQVTPIRSDGANTVEAKALGEAFPMRDSRGYVKGYYVYEGTLLSSGPYAHFGEAVSALGDHASFFNRRIICGHVFTSKGKAIRETPEYGADDRCTLCGSHIADPHSPSCPSTD